ncbi:MAG: DUF3990 domain-containing protein [Lachnospiraceae bacterium]|nr:DUF3990 domain-containing protein [Lachnospiraceae bacterium]
MEYNFSQDLKIIREILGLTQDELASRIDTQRVTISRNELEKTAPTFNLLEKVYSYAFEQNIKINKLKEMFYIDETKDGHKMLCHGAKDIIEGRLSVKKSRDNNDFGTGFYTGENYDQAASFISGFPKSSVYFLDFDNKGLVEKRYEVNRDWMLTIAYYRGTLEEYESHPIVKKLVKQSRECDYIVAPIADNRMFQIINSFISGEITDEQCKHCLSATNLGYQYVFVSDKSVNKIKLLERCYISEKERDYYRNIRSSESKLGDDKVKLARIKYRGKGKYIDELLK